MRHLPGVQIEGRGYQNHRNQDKFYLNEVFLRNQNWHRKEKKNPTMDEIIQIFNKDRISITDFSFCLRL